MVPGQRIGRFEVVETLGQGGIATVYRVRHAHLETLHAIKILKVGHPGLARRLLQEGKIQASLHHPNVVAVTDVIEDGGNIGLVMELVDGFSLEDCLAGEPMDLEEALDIFRQVLEGVAAAHAAGVTHRDLKPGNILLTTRSDRVLAKVTDFGIAKVFSEEGGPTMTRAGATMGTPGYMAPEQMRNSAAVDHRADIFALGAILYEMICGVPAFREADMLASLTRVAQGRYVPLDQAAPRAPRSVVDAVARALQPDPEDRFPDCAAFARAIYGEGVALPAPSSKAEAPARPARPARAAGPAPTLAPSELDGDLLSAAFGTGADSLDSSGTQLADRIATPSASETYDDRILPKDFLLEQLELGSPRGGSSDADSALSLDPLIHDEPVDDDDTEDVVQEGGDVLPDLFGGALGAAPRSEPGQEKEGDREGAEGLNADDAADNFKDLLRSFAEATLWAVGRVLRYGAFPILAFFVFLWWVSVRAGYRLEQLGAKEQAHEAALRTSMDASASLVPMLIQGGANESVLLAQRNRYELAPDIDAKMAAAKELSSVMSIQLASLPEAQTTAEREQRRRVELALARIDQDMVAFTKARDAHEAEAGSLSGRLAIVFGTAGD